MPIDSENEDSKNERIVQSVQHWLKALVIGLDLCPFAAGELEKNRVRFFVSKARSEKQLLKDLQEELEYLNQSEKVETTLLIHPDVLTGFYEYNQFLDLADSLLVELQFEGIFQIASFHPDYQFAGTQASDVENYTNKSPYPMLHLLREDSIERAVEGYLNADLIPESNIERLNSMGLDKVLALLKANPE